MSDAPVQKDSDQFSETLYAKMVLVNPGVGELELYEFRYALDNLTPAEGWDAIEIAGLAEVESLIAQKEFYAGVQLKPTRGGQIVLDETIARLTRMLFAGLAKGAYSVAWVNRQFYFDIRGFIFLVRTQYFHPSVLEHFGGRPMLQLEPAQSRLDLLHEIGYREFKDVNLEIDHAFLEVVQKIIALKSTPQLLAIVGPSAAGKTEIVERLRAEMAQNGKTAAVLEMDNFMKDREFRDGRPMDREIIHFEIFERCVADLMDGRDAFTPRYDFILGNSSHDVNGNLRSGQSPILIRPADIILLEGNFPLHIPEIAPLIDIKVVYLTDDPIRLKRKWKRDVDIRKKYDPVYLCNRYFRTQFLRAGEVYLPMMEICDVVADTTAAALWLTPEISARLELQPNSSRSMSL